MHNKLLAEVPSWSCMLRHDTIASSGYQSPAQAKALIDYKILSIYKEQASSLLLI